MIPADQHALLIGALLVILVIALAIERSRFGEHIPAPAVMLVGGILLTNLGIAPHDTEVFSQVQQTVVPIGVFLLLLRVNLRRILRETGAVLWSYLLGAALSVVGIVVAFLTVPIADGAAVSAVQAANLVGGTLNVVAVAQAVQMPAATFTAMYAGWAPVSILYLLSISALARSKALHKWLSHRTGASARQESQSEPARGNAKLDSFKLASVLTLAILTYALAEFVLAKFALAHYSVLAVTVVALVIANAAPGWVASLVGDREIGTMLMYLFFAALATNANLSQFGLEAVMIMCFIGLAVIVHTALILIVGRLFKADLFEVLIGSIAGIGGPTSAAAMASSFKQRDLIAPGILTGLLGFAIGTFVGIAVYHALS